MAEQEEVEDFDKNVTIQSVIKECKESEFTNNEVIGEGGFAAVYKALHKELGYVAIKQILFKSTVRVSNSATELEQELLEADIMIKHSSHPNIVRVYGLLIPDKKYFSDKYIGYIMELMEHGSLYRIIHDKEKKYSTKQVFSWMRQAALGVLYLHNSKIIHRDIKPANLLIGKDLDILKISDFGLAKPLTKDTTITRGVGTYVYMSPELLELQPYSYPSDIYALAISFWEMANRRRPYDHLEMLEFRIPTKILDNNERPQIETETPLNSLLQRGWQKEPSLRPAVEEFRDFAHKAFEEADDSQMINVGGKDLSKKLTQQHLATVDCSNLILIAGGKVTDTSLVDSMFLFDYTNGTWFDLSLHLPYITHGHAMLLLNGEIYIFGGGGNGTDHNCTYKLDANTMGWKQLAKMNSRRYGITCSSLVFDGCLWALGGWNGYEPLRSVEKFDPNTQIWTIMPSMNSGRVSGSAIVFNNKIYAFGGYNGNHFPKNVEFMDPQSGVWTIFCPFPKHRQGLAPVMDCSNLVILGGWSGIACVSNSWKINLEEGRAEELPDMEEAHTDFTAHKIGKNIVAIGGCNGFHVPDSTVEVFDEIIWRKGDNLPEKRAFHASVMITPEVIETLKKFVK